MCTHALEHILQLALCGGSGCVQWYSSVAILAQCGGGCIYVVVILCSVVCVLVFTMQISSISTDTRHSISMGFITTNIFCQSRPPAM